MLASLHSNKPTAAAAAAAAVGRQRGCLDDSLTLSILCRFLCVELCALAVQGHEHVTLSRANWRRRSCRRRSEECYRVGSVLKELLESCDVAPCEADRGQALEQLVVLRLQVFLRSVSLKPRRRQSHSPHQACKIPDSCRYAILIYSHI